MSPPRPAYGWLDDAALATGLGLVLIGLGVMGAFETLVGTAHLAERLPGVGVIIVHTSFSPRLRASVVALGFLVLFVWSCSRVSRTILESHSVDP